MSPIDRAIKELSAEVAQKKETYQKIFELRGSSPFNSHTAWQITYREALAAYDTAVECLRIVGEVKERS